MVSASVARNVVGIIGNIITLRLFILPAPIFYNIIKNKDVEEVKPDLFIITMLHCALWVFYGMPFVHPNSILVVTINGVGLVLQFVYLTIFFVYANNKARKKLMLDLLFHASFFATIVLITTLLYHDTNKRSSLVGMLCDVFTIIMYIAPLYIMADVIKTKSEIFMSVWLGISLNIFLNGLCWTTYALIDPFDIYVLISSGIGAIFGLVQLLFYAYYWCKGENNDDHANEISNPILSAV